MFPDLWIFVISVAGELCDAYAALGVLLIELYKHGRCVCALKILNSAAGTAGPTPTLPTLLRYTRCLTCVLLLAWF